MDEQALRLQMCAVGRRLWERDLIGACEGNLSVRLDDERLLCTPSGLCKGELVPADLLVIDLEGRLARDISPARGEESGAGVPRSKVSSEIKMHVGIYRHRTDCKAVVHAHPITATGFAAAGRTIPDDVLPEACVVLGRVALVPFGMPGTNEVPDGLGSFLMDHKTFLLANHGAVVMGKDLEDAANRMETLERVARVLLTANALGGAQKMPKEALMAMRQIAMDGRL